MRIGLLIAAVTLLLAGVPLAAHHSFAAEFDANKTFKMTGPVTKIEWTNPHVFFYVDVTDEQTKKVTNWTLQVGSPNGLMRSGWGRNSVKVGEVVTAEGQLARDGTALGYARSVVLTSTGQRLLSGPAPPP